MPRVWPMAIYMPGCNTKSYIWDFMQANKRPAPDCRLPKWCWLQRNTVVSKGGTPKSHSFLSITCLKELPYSLEGNPHSFPDYALVMPIVQVGTGRIFKFLDASKVIWNFLSVNPKIVVVHGCSSPYGSWSAEKHKTYSINTILGW